MSRHRIVRAMNIADEYYDDEDDVYGHSMEDNYCISPSTAAQFTYNRDRGHELGSFMHEDDIIEEETENDHQPLNSSTGSASRKLNDLERGQLNSCLDEIRNVVGETCPESMLTDIVIKNKFNIQSSLNEIFSQQDAPKPQRAPRENRRSRTEGKKKAAAEASNAIPQVITTSQDVSHLTDSVSQIKVSSSKGAVLGFKTSKQSAAASSSNNKLTPKNKLSPNSAETSPTGSTGESSASGFTVEEGSNKEQVNGSQETIKRSPSSSLLTSQIDGPSSQPSTPKSSAKYKQDRAALKAEYDKRQSGKEMINLVVIGHVDAGKSTLMGHLLFQLGNVNKKTMHKYEQESRKVGKSSFAYAWVLDETDEERSRGVTMDVAQTRFETDNKIITLLDAPGHKDFIPNMITGASQADVAILVVNATRGEFETGFESGGQTREHALLARSLGVGQLIVAVNKMDTVDWLKERYDDVVTKLRVFLKQAGFREGDVSFIPCSGLNGENLTNPATEPSLKAWYEGSTLLQQIDKFKCQERPVDKPFRLCVGDVFKGMGSGFSVSGRIGSGSVQTGDKVLVMPSGDIANVKGITIDESPTTYAFSGDHVVITITGVDINNVYLGSVLCDPSSPMKCTTRIRARVVIFNLEVPITRGFPVVFHYQSINEPAVIKKLISQLHKSTGEVIKSKPKCLMKNTSAVIEIEFEKPICLEIYKEFKDLGRFMLRQSGHTVAAGLVEEALPPVTKTD